MRVSKFDLNQLLGAQPPEPLAAPSKLCAAVPVAAPEASPLPAPPPPCDQPVPCATGPSAASLHVATQSPPLNRASASDVRFELAKVLPRLWAKAQLDAPAGKAATGSGKERLRALLVWLLEKRQAKVHLRHTLKYRHDGADCSGRLDLIAVSTGAPTLAVEIDWAYSKASLEKLLAAHRQGLNVLWVCGAKLDRDAAKALRVRANAEFGSTFGWLFMFHLDHGWL